MVYAVLSRLFLLLLLAKDVVLALCIAMLCVVVSCKYIEICSYLSTTCI